MTIEHLDTSTFKAQEVSEVASDLALEYSPSIEVMNRYIETQNQLNDVYSVVSEQQSYISALSIAYRYDPHSFIPVKYSLYRAGVNATLPGERQTEEAIEAVAERVATLEATLIGLAYGDNEAKLNSHAAHMYQPLRQMALLAQIDKSMHGKK